MTTPCSKVIDAAKAASDVGAFALATEILDREQLRWCVVCFQRWVNGRPVNFGGDTVRVCQLCQEEERVGPRYAGLRHDEPDEVLWIIRSNETYWGRHG